MQKFKSKKGFTLAELLIVVAIIAVLTAIAVPLFVGALSNAEKNVESANVRVVRGAAVVYLLDKTNDATLWAEPTKDNIRAWTVTAITSKSGELSNMEVKAVENGVAAKTTTQEGFTTEGKAEKQPDGSYKVTLLLTETGVSDIPEMPTP